MKPLAVNRFLAALTFALIVYVGVPLETSAQAVRSVQTFYVRPQIGLTSYIGDRSAALFSLGQGFPYAAGLELGYQFERPYSVGINYHFAHSPAIRLGGASSARHSLDAPFRYTFIENGATLRNSTGPAPYLTLGPHVTIGSAYPDGTNGRETRIAFGPLAGVGVDVPLNDQVSLFFEGATRAAFPDDAADGLKTDKFAGFDLLSTLNAGLKIGFKSGAVPPGAVAIDGPAQLDVGQPGTFTANVDGDATHPVEYRWHWEDGTVSAGLAATRTFSEPGTYTVTFAASNRAGAHSETLTVAVMAVEIPDPPEIRFIAAEPDSVDTETPVRFTTQVQ
jgi:hypothetical protein